MQGAETVCRQPAKLLRQTWIQKRRIRKRCKLISNSLLRCRLSRHCFRTYFFRPLKENRATSTLLVAIRGKSPWFCSIFQMMVSRLIYRASSIWISVLCIIEKENCQKQGSIATPRKNLDFNTHGPIEHKETSPEALAVENQVVDS